MWRQAACSAFLLDLHKLCAAGFGICKNFASYTAREIKSIDARRTIRPAAQLVLGSTAHAASGSPAQLVPDRQRPPAA